jgi:hypothetical protein
MLAFGGQSDLDLIIQKRHLLADIPSILVLPENSPSEALLQAHMLRPRALFSDGGNWQAAIQILVRMYERRLAEHSRPSMAPYENNNILENNG